MPTNPLTLLNLCRAIEQTSADTLIDRETLLATQKALKALKRDVDRTQVSKTCAQSKATWSCLLDADQGEKNQDA
jgi:hypothetical protein